MNIVAVDSARMRIAFFGTPAFAVPALDALAARHEVALVVAQPDRPSGRGMKLQPPAVAVRARELSLEVAQPARMRDEEFIARLTSLAPDVAIVVAYGKILPARLLEIPRHGFINIHGSILPKYRGAAPIQRAIEAGDSETGVTIMRIDEQLDHGPMFSIVRTPIGPDERAPAIGARLAAIGAEALLEVLDAIGRGVAVETGQDHANATHAAKVEKHEGLVTFSEPASNIYNRFRAFDPWPGIFFESAGETVKVTEMRPAEVTLAPRTVGAIDDGVTVGTGERSVRLIALQRPGKKPADAAAVARALGWSAGAAIP